MIGIINFMAKEKIHILGICGTFMGGLAILGKEAGLEISGCDSNIYPPMSDHLSKWALILFLVMILLISLKQIFMSLETLSQEETLL